MSWFLSDPLIVFERQMRAAFPGIEIGDIGDARHQKEHSDHNPDPDGSVHAVDPMLGPHFSKLQADLVVDALIRSRDRRIHYLIWQRQIISCDGATPWEWTDYHGSDPHTGHFHLSDNRENSHDRSSWKISLAKRNAPMLKIGEVEVALVGEGDDDSQLNGPNMVRRIQLLRGITADGVWGSQTTKAVGAARMTVELYKSIFGLQ